jgi:hypothetical protein
MKKIKKIKKKVVAPFGTNNNSPMLLQTHTALLKSLSLFFFSYKEGRRECANSEIAFCFHFFVFINTNFCFVVVVDFIISRHHHAQKTE